MDAYSRRFVLGGLLAGLAGAAEAEAPRRSPRPVARGGTAVASTMSGPRAAAADGLIEAAKLGGKVSYVVADAATGLVLESHEPDEAMPPASTAKAITSLYALAHLGGAWRFQTQVLGTGPVRDGVVQGDLVLSGGGDPELDTDDLGDLAIRLKSAGVTGATGRFLVWGGALPYLRELDAGQPDHVGYSPAISGLNLNFNRLYFEWKRQGSGYDVALDARGARFRPMVGTARMAIVERSLPVYTYSDVGELEEWTVAKGALGRGGSRWLPVRRPALYAGDVFRVLARAQGITLEAPVEVTERPEGAVLADVLSGDLRHILRDMMKYSTNLTAEVVGMTASLRAGSLDSPIGSAQAMSDWLSRKAGAQSARFADHSGLGGASRISAGDMVRALVRLGPAAGLPGLMKEIPAPGADGKPAKGVRKVLAKTGTLNFVSALTGFVTVSDGHDLAFAIFTGDVARRDAIPPTHMERPDGGSAWIGRSRQLQQQLIARWGTVYGV